MTYSFAALNVSENGRSGQKGIDMANMIDLNSPLFGAGVRHLQASRSAGRAWRGVYARNWLGETPLQRTNAWRKLAVSLKPKCSAIR